MIHNIPSCDAAALPRAESNTGLESSVRLLPIVILCAACVLPLRRNKIRQLAGKESIGFKLPSMSLCHLLVAEANYSSLSRRTKWHLVNTNPPQ